MFHHVSPDLSDLPGLSDLPDLPDAALRLFAPSHAGALFALVDANRAYLRVWLPCLDELRSVADAAALIAAAREQTAAGGIVAGVWYRGELAGMVGFNALDPANRAAEIGYWLGAGFQGRGIMTCAVRAVVQYAFAELRLHRVTAMCAVGNTRSAAVVRRLGFTCETVIREVEWLSGHFVDDEVYVMDAANWRLLHAAVSRERLHI